MILKLWIERLFTMIGTEQKNFNNRRDNLQIIITFFPLHHTLFKDTRSRALRGTWQKEAPFSIMYSNSAVTHNLQPVGFYNFNTHKSSLFFFVFLCALCGIKKTTLYYPFQRKVKVNPPIFVCIAAPSSPSGAHNRYSLRFLHTSGQECHMERWGCPRK